MQSHEKIISETAKKFLAPEGFFQKASSRIWLDDRGYYIILVEFQPSAFTKGTYLNVGVSFLFETNTAPDDTLAYDIGGRISGFAEYRDDITFQKEIERFAVLAMKQVRTYRKLDSLHYAQKLLQKAARKKSKTAAGWDLYHLALVCFLQGSLDKGVKAMDAFLESIPFESQIPWHTNLRNYCTQTLMPMCSTWESAQDMVEDMINRRRTLFMSKASFKKMNGTYSVSSRKAAGC